jgi:hypothetical protein
MRSNGVGVCAAPGRVASREELPFIHIDTDGYGYCLAARRLNQLFKVVTPNRESRPRLTSNHRQICRDCNAGKNVDPGVDPRCRCRYTVNPTAAALQALERWTRGPRDSGSRGSGTPASEHWPGAALPGRRIQCPRRASLATIGRLCTDRDMQQSAGPWWM